MAGAFVTMGVLHFLVPKRFESIMPPYIPLHREAVLVSGAAEIAGGLALLSPKTRPFARWWLLGLLAAVFPANIHMAVSPEQVRGIEKVPRWTLWARLPLQGLMALGVWRASEN